MGTRAVARRLASEKQMLVPVLVAIYGRHGDTVHPLILALNKSAEFLIGLALAVDS